MQVDFLSENILKEVRNNDFKNMKFIDLYCGEEMN